MENNDLISRKALFKRIEKAKSEATDIRDLFFFDGIMAIIDTQPSVSLDKN